MKRLFFACLFFISFVDGYSQSVSINTDGPLPNASAIPDVKSAVKGLLLPRTSSIHPILIHPHSIKMHLKYHQVSLNSTLKKIT